MKTAETVALLPVACGVPGGMLRRKTERIRIAGRRLSERKPAICADPEGALRRVERYRAGRTFLPLRCRRPSAA